MKRRILIAALLLAGELCAQTPANQYTGGLFNCRHWISIPDVGLKVFFLEGYFDASQLIKESEVLLPWKTPLGELQKGLDEICGPPENAKLTIRQGLELFRMKVDGKSSLYITNMTETFRRVGAEAK